MHLSRRHNLTIALCLLVVPLLVHAAEARAADPGEEELSWELRQALLMPIQKKVVHHLAGVEALLWAVERKSQRHLYWIISVRI